MIHAAPSHPLPFPRLPQALSAVPALVLAQRPRPAERATETVVTVAPTVAGGAATAAAVPGAPGTTATAAAMAALPRRMGLAARRRVGAMACWDLRAGCMGASVHKFLSCACRPYLTSCGVRVSRPWPSPMRPAGLARGTGGAPGPVAPDVGAGGGPGDNGRGDGHGGGNGSAAAEDADGETLTGGCYGKGAGDCVPDAWKAVRPSSGCVRSSPLCVWTAPYLVWPPPPFPLLRP